jgi:glycerate-2-kinase
MAAALAPDDRLLVLLSGGASALMAVPAKGLTLSDKVAVTQALLKGGAGIRQVNAVRKHLSGIKGGQLAIASRAPVMTLAISDVIGDDFSVIGSGPTVGDTSTFADAMQAVTDARPQPSRWPDAAIRRLKAGVAGEIPETPKPGDPRFRRHQSVVIGSRLDAMAGAAAEARARGYETVVLEEAIAGEASLAGSRLVAQVADIVGQRPRDTVCVVTSGETTVHVVGSGLGGRNQELVLGALKPLAALRRHAVLASVGTDGVDGPTPAAGAIGDTGSQERAEARALRPDDFLRRNDAYHFFETMGDLIKTGPTGTNVGDLQVCVVSPRMPNSPGGPIV